RITEVSMQRRHGVWADAALEAVAHHERIAAAQLLHEPVEPAEIVAVVGVAHDDVAAAGGGDAGAERRAVAALGGRDHPGPGLRREPARFIARAVVGDQHLALDAGTLEEAARFLDA